MVAKVFTFSQRSRLEQEIFLREIHLRKAKLSNAADLSVLFAIFSVLGAAELNIKSDDDRANLICAYVISSALTVSNTVLVKVGLLWMIPSLDTAVLLGYRDTSEFDRVPPLFLLWDVIWLLASNASLLLFVTQFVLIAWIKYPLDGIAVGATVIMTPILVLVLISIGVSLKQFGRPVLNLDKFKREFDLLQGV